MILIVFIYFTKMNIYHVPNMFAEEQKMTVYQSILCY